jgi:hypothetical protein
MMGYSELRLTSDSRPSMRVMALHSRYRHFKFDSDDRFYNGENKSMK